MLSVNSPAGAAPVRPERVCSALDRLPWSPLPAVLTTFMASQGTTEKLSYSSIFNPLIRRSTLYCNPVLLLGSISSAPRSVLAHYFGLKYNTGCEPKSS